MMATPPKQSRPGLDYQNKLILAPMVKIGTLPFRLLALHYGADLVYTEELIDFRLLRSERLENKVLNTVDFIDRTDDTLVLRISPEERGHLVLQMGTACAKRAVKVAKMVENDVDGIDINMGCPKPFSIKGGMGAALLSQPDKITDILTSLVAAVSIPVTCKIRILKCPEATMELVKVIEKTGVRALAVHGRTKDERPNHQVHVDRIKHVVENTSLPIICNGGSSNNRNSADNTYEGIHKFWRETGASSVMLARAAEWNPSVFRPESAGGKVDYMTVCHKYLDYAIHYNYTPVIVKYTMQQILGSEQDSPMGKKFLNSFTMRDMCAVFGRQGEIVKRQIYIREQSALLNIVSTTFRTRRDAVITPRQRTLSNGEEVTEMFAPFVRGHFDNGKELPKNHILTWARQNGHEDPVYTTKLTEKTFRSEVAIAGKRFSSESWEKNKKYAEQSAAIVALHCLGVKEICLKEKEDEVTK